MNSICVMGRIAHDLELKQNPTLVNFDIYVRRAFRKEGSQEGDYIKCVAFGKLAENLVKYQGKGHMIAVSGRFETMTYSTKDGQKRNTWNVVAENISYAESKRKEEKPGWGPQSQNGQNFNTAPQTAGATPQNHALGVNIPAGYQNAVAGPGVSQNQQQWNAGQYQQQQPQPNYYHQPLNITDQDLPF